MANMFLSKLKGGSSVNLQASKTVTAGTTQQTFAPDTGYDAMEEVVVNPTPSTSITPSNASPVDIAANTLYKPTAAGKAVASVSNITPSNSSPASMSTGNIYKPSAGGYAITSYQSKTPASGGTPFDAGMVKMSSGGYAYDSQQSGGTLKYTVLHSWNTMVDTVGSFALSDENYNLVVSGKAIIYALTEKFDIQDFSRQMEEAIAEVTIRSSTSQSWGYIIDSSNIASKTVYWNGRIRAFGSDVRFNAISAKIILFYIE